MLPVAPFAGAWIEINWLLYLLMPKIVAPFAGAWIEISLSMRLSTSDIVAPFAGAWIGIQLAHTLVWAMLRRPLCRSVNED